MFEDLTVGSFHFSFLFVHESKCHLRTQKRGIERNKLIKLTIKNTFFDFNTGLIKNMKKYMKMLIIYFN